MGEEETDQIEILRQRVAEAQARVDLALIDYEEDLCTVHAVDEAVRALETDTTDLEAAQLPVM